MTITPGGGIGTPSNTAIKVDSNPNGEGPHLAIGGDTGGPWFIGGTALGIISCEQGADAIYVAINMSRLASTFSSRRLHDA